MAVYYNEFDPKKAAWLRELIHMGLIAAGDVDERSISDVLASDLIGYTQCHFFAGIGVWSHALRAAGISDDEEVWTGSCPCQPFSAIGSQTGFADERHLWPAWDYLIGQRKPRRIYGEQVASKAGLDWLDLVLTDLEAQGYARAAADLCAAGVGAPHVRQRLFIAAGRLDDGDGARPQGYSRNGGAARGQKKPQRSITSAGVSLHGDATNGHWREADWLEGVDDKWRPVQSGTFPMDHGIAARVVRCSGYGNAIVSQLAQAFIECSEEAFADIDDEI